MASFISLATVASLLAVLPTSMAAFSPGSRNNAFSPGSLNNTFSPGSQKNIAIYWGKDTGFAILPRQDSDLCQGQNSINQGSGPLAQKRLGYYCESKHRYQRPGVGSLTTYAREDIKTCQDKHSKTIVLSLGGATYSQGGWSSPSEAEAAAQTVWDMFGPVQSGNKVNRPFGSAVVDGFDFDFESTTNNLPAFGAKLRSLMDGAGGKKFYLAAAPQCVFPDAAVGAALDAVAFDFVMIQFYNNWCGVSNFKENATTQDAFNFDVWDKWAHGSKNPDVKLLLGIPAAPGAGGGYTEGSKLKAAINYSQKFSSFGGVMMWDMSQLYSNSGYLKEVLSDIAGGPTTTVPPGTTTTSSPCTTSSPPPSGGLDKYAQCGGNGYNGPTVCKAPYTCVKLSDWWSSCK
uniref:chitinase n=1 Tax=Beauveria bassiana TaxID=176275 RepID=A0A097F8L2_BEABA|nr:chitinase [Beauveria bassiana]